MNWMQVRDHASRDDRAILPIGSTEQHAYLSLCVDSILSEKVALEAAEPLAVPVFPVINYGLTPSFIEYPGTVTLKMSTLCAIVTDVLDGIVRSGFRRIVIVNGHGGNSPAHGAVLEWLGQHRGVQVKAMEDAAAEFHRARLRGGIADAVGGGHADRTVRRRLIAPGRGFVDHRHRGCARSRLDQHQQGGGETHVPPFRIAASRGESFSCAPAFWPG